MKLFKNNNKNLLLIYSYYGENKLGSAYVLDLTEQNGVFCAQQISKATFLPSVKANDINLTQMDNNLLGYSVLSKELNNSLPDNYIHLLRENIPLINFNKDAVFYGNMHEMQLPNYLSQNKLSALSYNLKGIWYIDESLTIPRGQTLTISPNTKLFFTKGATLTVDGNFTINAPADKPVVFCSQLPNQQWEGIKGSGANSINLNNVIIRDAATGVAEFGSAFIHNSKFYNCEVAINIRDAQSVDLARCRVEGCNKGIYITNTRDDYETDYSISDCVLKPHFPNHVTINHKNELGCMLNNQNNTCFSLKT